MRLPPTSTLFPYTTLFRSQVFLNGLPLVFQPGKSAGLNATFHFTFTGHEDRKSTRLNSSHGSMSYAVFCLKKKRPLGLPGQRLGEIGALPGELRLRVAEVA